MIREDELFAMAPMLFDIYKYVKMKEFVYFGLHEFVAAGLVV
jgi:hypothetical protein